MLAQRGRADRDALELVVQRFVREQLVQVRPHVVEAFLDATLGLVGAQAQAQNPLCRVVLVVLDLLDRLVRDGGQGLVLGGLQRRVELVLVEGEQQLAGDGLPEVTVLLLDQADRAELLFVAEVREVVLGLAPRGTRVGQEEASVTHHVQGNVAQGNVFLELGSSGDPPAQALSQHQGIVPEAQGILGDRLGRLATGARDVLSGDRISGGLLSRGVV